MEWDGMCSATFSRTPVGKGSNQLGTIVVTMAPWLGSHKDISLYTTWGGQDPQVPLTRIPMWNKRESSISCDLPSVVSMLRRYCTAGTAFIVLWWETVSVKNCPKDHDRYDKWYIYTYLNIVIYSYLMIIYIQYVYIYIQNIYIDICKHSI